MELHAFNSEPTHARSQTNTTSSSEFFSCPDRTCYRVTYEDNLLQIRHRDTGKQAIWQLNKQADRLHLAWIDAYQAQPEVTELLAALEAAFTIFPHHQRLNLSVAIGSFADLIESGIILRNGDEQMTVYADLFWQQAAVWRLPAQFQPYPLHYVFSNGRRHPLRPPKPSGIVYRRYITWLQASLTFRTVDLDTDLACFHRWMNDAVVAEFWQEAGDLAKHRDYLATIASDAHVVNLIACLDDEPFGYFEIYWAKEDRLAPFYDVDDFDRGWHVLIGESHRRGKPYVTAWLPSISHYLFLDDCRTQRLVIEPRVDNHKMMRNLAHCGYASLKLFDFPHKRAMLNMLLRERFFSEQLWVPRNPVASRPVLLP